MERAVAIKKLGRLLGKGFGYRFDAAAPLKDERQEAREQLKEALRIQHRIREERRQRCEAVLAADTEYQRLVAEDKEITERTDRLGEVIRWYRVTVGKSNGMFFTVEAQGDSWEDVIAKVSAKEKV